MSVANLHSLFNRPWYIEQNYAQGYLPLIFGMLVGNHMGANDTEKEKPSLISYHSSKGNSNTANVKVAILEIKNPIVKHDQMCGPQGTKGMMRELDALKGSDIAGVVLDIDSGGGQAYGTPEFYDYLSTYPKPVVTYTDGLMCSAAYYIGSAAQEIIANKRAEHIGSIGAYAKLLDIDGYYGTKGLKVHTMYATKSTEKNKASRDVFKEEGSYETYIKEELDPLVDTFISDIKTARPQIDEAVFKGGTYNAEKAKEMKLVDSLGTINDAIDRVIELSKDANKKSTQMSKNYTKIESVIGKKFGEGETANGILLNEAEADQVEAKISALESDLQAAKTEKATAEKAVTDAVATHNAIVLGANKELELTGEDKVTDVTGAITAYKNKITALGNEPGDDHTTGKKKEDVSGDHGFINFESSIYQN